VAELAERQAELWSPLSCDNYLYGLKGAPSARQADRPEPYSQSAPDMHAET
jgi:hypothetical protein